jgi:hypothetical protein
MSHSVNIKGKTIQIGQVLASLNNLIELTDDFLFQNTHTHTHWLNDMIFYFNKECGKEDESSG